MQEVVFALALAAARRSRGAYTQKVSVHKGTRHIHLLSFADVLGVFAVVVVVVVVLAEAAAAFFFGSAFYTTKKKKMCQNIVRRFFFVQHSPTSDPVSTDSASAASLPCSSPTASR